MSFLLVLFGCMPPTLHKNKTDNFVLLDYVGDETTQEFLQRTMEAFSTIAPGFRGPEKVEKSVSDMLAVFEKATVEDPEWRGNFVSQFGNKQWL